VRRSPGSTSCPSCSVSSSLLSFLAKSWVRLDTSESHTPSGHVIYLRRSWPFLFVSPFFLGVGSGLLYTLTTSTSSATIAGFQILSGIGVAMGMQNSLIAIQCVNFSRPCILTDGRLIEELNSKIRRDSLAKRQAWPPSSSSSAAPWDSALLNQCSRPN
jgi:hypothetical protein